MADEDLNLLRQIAQQESGEKAADFLRSLDLVEQRRSEAPPRQMEARDLLASNPSEHPIALNHFCGRVDTEKFVERLYALGAGRVLADNVSYDDDSTRSGPYTDSLVVQLPEDKDSREALVSLCNEHCMADASTGAKFVDQGQPTLYLWWD